MASCKSDATMLIRKMATHAKKNIICANHCHNPKQKRTNVIIASSFMLLGTDMTSG